MTFNSDHTTNLVQLGSSFPRTNFEMNFPESPHHTFTNLKKADWDSLNREAEDNFTLLKLLSPCRTGESSSVNSSTKQYIPQCNIPNLSPNLNDITKRLYIALDGHRSPCLIDPHIHELI